MTDLTRFWRGYQARVERAFLLRCHDAATEIQRIVRGRIHYRNRSAKMAESMAAIHPIARGFLGRLRARSRIEKLYAAGMKDIHAEREQMRQKLAAVTIKRFFRGSVGWRGVIRRARKAKRERDTLKAMQDHIKEQDRQLKIYQDKFQTDMARELAKRQAKEAEESHTQNQKGKLLSYQRKLRREEWTKKDREDAAKKEKARDKEWDVWKATWKKKFDKEMALERKLQDRLVKSSAIDQNSMAQAMQAREAKKTIERETKALMQKYKNVGAELNYEMAWNKCYTKFIDKALKRKKEALRQERRDDYEHQKLVFQDKDHNDWTARVTKEYNRTKWLVGRLQGFWRIKQAKKELKALLLKSWVKEFDPDSRIYRYRNTQTGLVQYTRPLKMMLDMEVPAKLDEWVAMTDQFGKLYYFRPETGKMSWLPPPGCTMCIECGQQFAEMTCVQCGDPFCHGCYEKLHATGRRRAHEFVNLPGSVPEKIRPKAKDQRRNSLAGGGILGRGGGGPGAGGGGRVPSPSLSMTSSFGDSFDLDRLPDEV